MPSDSPRDSSDQDGQTTLRRREPPLSAKLSFAGHVYGLQAMLRPLFWFQDWKEYFYPTPDGPNIIKTYECRPYLPVRIFLPHSYDPTSSHPLPTLLTIHGGGFCIGHVRDDDAWNRAFANTNSTLVIALNYSKAPSHPFPHAIHDVAALLLAALSDDSLPLHPSHVALAGFSAGATLALAAVQLPAVRAHPRTPRAVLSFYGYLDMATPPEKKLVNRPYKANLPLPRGSGEDGLMALLPTFDWAYLPYGQDLRDPLVSPYYAERGRLPEFVGVVAAELDLLAHESWRFACRVAGEGTERRGEAVRRRFEVREARSKETGGRICGRRGVTGRQGVVRVLEKDGGEVDERFAWEEEWEGGGAKWLLVPDVLHAFDNKNIREIMGGEETVVDAEEKTKKVIEDVGRWLREKVWKMEGGE
ncbi:Alpha/Beta hydrolase protein [Schizothecium vesticola]|uniref:Alpha/Beta hydrolase protein n=1 Tax=Schizothecium vesticola TaxID=314040 RepID=A0AA40BP37_9PEZI|nr:Alpha/Beta hydrolase protein [Schizothecium vesticola]